MFTKKGKVVYESDTNQLPYSGNPGTHAFWLDVFSFSEDTSIGGYPITRFSASWPAVDESYSPVYSKIRIRNESLNSNSFWSVPNVLYTPVRYGIYKRQVTSELNQTPWSLVEVTTKNSFTNWTEDVVGRIQYAICIYHKNAFPQTVDGYYWGWDNSIGEYKVQYLTNQYMLVITDPYDPRMNTRGNLDIQVPMPTTGPNGEDIFIS